MIITVHPDCPIVVESMDVPTEGTCINLTAADGLTIYLPGFGAVCAQHARSLADQLLRAADAISPVADVPTADAPPAISPVDTDEMWF